MLDFSQTLAKIGRFLNEIPGRNRKSVRERSPNCCSAEFYERAQRAALRVRTAAKKASTAALADPPTVDVTPASALSALRQALTRLGDTLHLTPEKHDSIVTVSLPWEANDASTSATGS